ncbi:MAG: transposase [bacterium]
MSYRYDNFAPGEIFHICTRGVESRVIFRHNSDRQRFRSLMLHYLSAEQVISFSIALKFKQDFVRTAEGEGLVDILSYCLMPNHIHLLLKENIEGGISKYMQRLLNSYAKHFNMSQGRSGSLFSNPFKAVLVDSEEQLLHVSRYIHLNPYVAHIVKNIFNYPWSSLNEYMSKVRKPICHKSLINSLLNKDDYEKFVEDDADYAKPLADIQHALIDYEV